MPVQNAIMVNPTEDMDWDFDYQEAWYGRAILFFTTTLKRKRGLPDMRVRLAFGQWYHKYDLTKGKSTHCHCYRITCP
jgi:hypothetical protein